LIADRSYDATKLRLAPGAVLPDHEHVKIEQTYMLEGKEYIHYFCGNTEIATNLEQHEPQRAALYKTTAALVRAYAGIADELEQAGYGDAEVAKLKKQMEHFVNVREVIRRASGETIDLKAYEADMRHLIDTYIQADEPRKISPFDGMSLVELIVKTGIADAIATRLAAFKGNKNAIAEAIENNVRSKIIKEHLNDPAYYEKISALLDEIIADRRAKAVGYEEYLKRIADIAQKVEMRMIRRRLSTHPASGRSTTISERTRNWPSLLIGPSRRRAPIPGAVSSRVSIRSRRPSTTSSRMSMKSSASS
jgi:hypothetical protein